MLPPSIRAVTYFAFNPKRLIIDPVKGCINDGFELVESIQYIACKVLDDDDEHKGKLLSLKDMIKLGIVEPTYKSKSRGFNKKGDNEHVINRW